MEREKATDGKNAVVQYIFFWKLQRDKEKGEMGRGVYSKNCSNN